MIDFQLSPQELETISGSKEFDPRVLMTPVPPDQMGPFGRLGPLPINTNRDKQIKRLRKIIRRLRKRNKD